MDERPEKILCDWCDRPHSDLSRVCIECNEFWTDKYAKCVQELVAARQELKNCRGVSDTTQQQIREQLTRIFSAPLVVDDGQFAEIFHEQIEEFMSAMNGLLSGSIESSKE